MKRRTLTTLILLVFILSLLTSLTGCYVIKSGKLKNVVGAYELTSYSTDKNELEERGISLYIIISSDGSGYYAYSDEETPLYIAELKCRFTRDSEDDKKYSYVEIDFGDGVYEKFGVNSTWSSKTLSSSVPVWGGSLFDGTLSIEYYKSATFTRTNKSTELSYLTKLLDFTGDPLPYGAAFSEGEE